MNLPVDFICLNNIENGIKAIEKCQFNLLEKDLITVDYNNKKYLIVNKFEIDNLANHYMDLHYAMSVYKRKLMDLC